MELLPSPEHEEIVRSVAGLLADVMPPERLRALRNEASTRDRRLWSRSAEQGWFGLGLAERLGGVGYGLAEETLLFKELGRALAPGPLLGTTLAAWMAATAGEAELASTLLDGSVAAGLALARPSSSGPGARVPLRGDFDAIDGEDATLTLIVEVSGAGLYANSDLPAGVAVDCIDPFVRLRRFHAEGVQPRARLDGDETWQRGLVLVAAMQVGIAEATRDAAVGYASERVQFGRPIGVNQAIKHRCADMAVRAEAAGAQTLLAALAVDERRADSLYQATAAKLIATRSATANAAANIQIHGGIGYTFEHAAHLYLRRAHVLEHVLGDQRHHLAAILQMPAYDAFDETSGG